MQEHLQTLSDWTIGGMCTGFAVICGCIRYMTSVEAGREFSWRALLTEGASSGAIGAMAFGVVSSYEIAPGYEGAVCGMAGWLGAVLAKVALAALMKHLGVTKADIES